MSRQSRRQNRQKTFGWRAQMASPVAHNAGVARRKAWRRYERAMHLGVHQVRAFARELARALHTIGGIQ